MNQTSEMNHGFFFFKKSSDHWITIPDPNQTLWVNKMFINVGVTTLEETGCAHLICSLCYIWSIYFKNSNVTYFLSWHFAFLCFVWIEEMMSSEGLCRFADALTLYKLNREILMYLKTTEYNICSGTNGFPYWTVSLLFKLSLNCFYWNTISTQTAAHGLCRTHKHGAAMSD